MLYYYLYTFYSLPYLFFVLYLSLPSVKTILLKLYFWNDLPSVLHSGHYVCQIAHTFSHISSGYDFKRPTSAKNHPAKW